MPLAFTYETNKMKRLYAKLTGGTEEVDDYTPSLTGLLAAFLCGVLVTMIVHWILF
jgi:hypothetical protein